MTLPVGSFLLLYATWC